MNNKKIEWTFRRVDDDHVEGCNAAGNVRMRFVRADGCWDGTCTSVQELNESYRRIRRKPDAGELAAIMQEAGQAFRDFLLQEGKKN